MSSDSTEEELSRLFGSYRAEWLAEKLYDLFTEPSYFPEMKAPTACVLEGGRGTGKTTVLRGLSYRGQFELHKRSAASIENLPFVGCYYRVDTNVVSAFAGPEVTDIVWQKLFGHYFNLVVCEQLASFWLWYRAEIRSDVPIADVDFQEVTTALHLPETSSVRTIHQQIRAALVEFEAYINNVGDSTPRPRLSLQGTPVRYFVECIRRIPAFANKQFFVLIDEYENLLAYQQQVINTLIKHGSEGLNYKIAIRELGWKCRTTLNPEEQLLSPADYRRINIGEKLEGRVFREFALKVCNDRVQKLLESETGPHVSIEQLLPGLSDEEEAMRLASGESVSAARVRVSELAGSDLRDVVCEMSPHDVLLVDYLLKSPRQVASELVRHVNDRTATWRDLRNNYSRAMLFTLKRGKAGLRKYYCGWDTFISLADKNIRFLLALVDQCLQMQLRDGRPLTKPIDQQLQTKAAQQIGKSNLSELEGLTVFGGRLTKLLLGLGRVFGILAAKSEGHSPEQTEFEIVDELDDSAGTAEIDELLRAAVMHLALVRPRGTKATDDGDTKDYDYMIHPIFSAFFQISYRKKRKIALSRTDLAEIQFAPKTTINSILSREKRSAEDEPLPEQLQLFGRFFDGSSR